jgi:pimeloyl-ACP methyl ester carboxylesterase
MVMRETAGDVHSVWVRTPDHFSLRFALLFIALVLLTTCQTSRQVSTDQIKVKTILVNGADLAYVEQGTGETVVFVHGAAGDWRTWESVRPFIAQKYHFVALSRRYHFPNKWTDDGSRYSMDQQVDDVAAFIRGLNVGRVHLVGGSWGGRLVGYLAVRYPELLRSVVMSDPSGLIAPTSPEGKAAIADYQKDIAESRAAANRGDAREAAIILFNAVHGDSKAFENAAPVRQQRFLDNARTLGPMFAGTAPTPIRCEDLAGLKVPAMVLRGENTRANFRFGDEAALACLPVGTASAVIPSAPHMWYPVAPKAGAEEILAFIAKH